MLKQFFTTYLQITTSLSNRYLKAQSLTLLIYFTYGVSNLLVLDVSAMPGSPQEYALRSLIDSVVFVLLSHFLLRSHLKLFVLNKGITLIRSFYTFVVLLLACYLYVLTVTLVRKLPVFAASQTESITFEMNGKNVHLTMEDPTLWFLMITNVGIFYLGWILLYTFWHSSKSKKKLQRQMQEARIQQLTNQLSPHFLFNTMNSIRALIFEDREKAANLVTQLSEIFRTHLQAHLQSKASLEQEWNVAERYLIIEQARLEERLQITCSIDDELWQQPLPTLSLLTLVENAIKHGIAPNPDSGSLNIYSEVIGKSRWRLTVRNSVSNHLVDEGTKTGLKNTHDRLQLMFGENMTYSAKRESHEFIVTIEMPYAKYTHS
ncbi:sensor histidine kinase [Alteromonas halophila]|uniref:Signal transduction histidine kinase internal region domain-containing protein n=1 Tax=Alteromonas halophila TaxID=516698 RepID=A0A918JJT8_9ALTE|nr:histidine kinase [Alteromonas halophila]GGW83950.1 hypothetical protein GCM10007391_16970 [Alteromonas halophila]